MNWYKQIPLQRKILAACLVVILVPLTVLVVLVLRRSMEEEIDRSTVSMTQANEMIDDRLETIVNHIKTTSAMYLVYPDIIQYVKNDFNVDRTDYITTLRELRKNVMSARINPYVSSITYLSDEGSAYSGAGYNENYMEQIKEFAGAMKENKIKNMLSPVYETVINQQNVKTITYGFSLVDTYTFEHVGYAFINLDLKQFGQSFQVFTEDGSMDTMAVQGDYVIYQGAHVTDKTAARVAEELRGQKGDFTDGKNLVTDLAFAGDKWRCVATYNEALDLTIISMAAGKVLKLKMLRGMVSYVVIVTIMIAVFVGVSVLLSIKLTRPIRVLEEGMHEVENGRLVPITQELDRQDDLGRLIHGFNTMTARLRESILKEYESRNLQKKAQIMMLESQINPHFLYNTLNVINSIAILEEVPEISELATSLGDMFRYNISGGSLVTVKDEITQIRRYAAIQRMCMAGQIEMIYEIEEEAEQKRILKFLLQPLVENCFEHGFSGDKRDGEIRIKASSVEGIVTLIVEDNGAGMSAKRLRQLTDKCREQGALCLEQEEKDSIGLLNVNFRLKNYYGEAYGLNLTSEVGVGTRITIRIPEGEREKEKRVKE